MTPLPGPVSILLRINAAAAMAALLLISVSHRDLFAWATEAIRGEEPASLPPKANHATHKASGAVLSPAFGHVDPKTHIFTPTTNGSVYPGDCLKWGPGLTDAGVACSGGGEGGSGPLTIYTTHSGLVNNVRTPTKAWMVQQQGFYKPGDHGGAAYQWNFESYCPGGTSSAPTPADSIVCVLPIGQSASTPGRYLLQTGNGIDVRQIGMVGDGSTDNYPFVATLMAAIAPQGFSGGNDVIFPHKAGEYYTDYYFSKSFHISRHMNINCPGLATGGSDASTRLVFAPGIHGVIFDTNVLASDGQYGGGGMTGCGVVGKSYHEGFSTTTGSNVLTNVGGEHTYGVWDFQVGDAIIAYRYASWDASAPFGPPGTTVASVDSAAHSLTLSPPVSPTATGAHGFSSWRLPASLAYTINTTNGSSTVTVTGGPDLLRPGDYIWSDAFPFGTVVMKESGTVGAQTITMGTWPLEGYAEQNATATRAGGKMWLIPAGIKMHVQTSLHKNYLSSWGIGLEMECSSWSVPGPSGCNNSYAQENQFWFNVIGRLVVGDNAGASTSIGNGYAYESMADVVEGGAVGSTYYNENTNSQEASSSLYGIIGLCVNSNSSAFFGGYNTSTGGYCLNQWGQPTTPGGTVMFIANQETTPEGAPTIYNGNFFYRWYFSNRDADGTQLCMNMGADVALAWSSGNQSCGGPLTWALAYNNPGFWGLHYYGVVGGAPMRLTEGGAGGYTGYNAGNLAFMSFPQGFLLFDAERGGAAPGPERLVDAGPSIPAATFHKQGDVHINQASVAGGSAGWIDTANGANFKPFGPVANDAAGTQWTLGSYITLTPVALASLPATCTAGTFAVINNGVASPTYNAAVGSTTGAAIDPVFCGKGNVWKYH
jgi:hypothetical protein